MAMVGVVSGSLYRRTHSVSRLAWSWVGGRLAPFYIHQMNRVNSRNGSACHDDSTINIVLDIILYYIILLYYIYNLYVLVRHNVDGTWPWPSVRPFVRPYEWTHFDANWHKWSTWRGHETITLGVKRSKVKVILRIISERGLLLVEFTYLTSSFFIYVFVTLIAVRVCFRRRVGPCQRSVTAYFISSRGSVVGRTCPSSSSSSSRTHHRIPRLLS